MKYIAIVFLVIGVVVAGGYTYVRFHALKTHEKKTTISKKATEKTKPEESPIDLRPKIIAKLQDLVKQGSGGLYILSIHSIDPDIISGRLKVHNVLMIPDTSALNKLDLLKKAPDDIFKIKIDSILIDGITLNDLLSKKSIDLNQIKISKPNIEVFHQKRSYNEKWKRDTSDLYKNINGQMKHLSIKNISIINGKFTDHNLTNGKTKVFSGVHIFMHDLLMDSTTQCDQNRFCFSKEAHLSLDNYEMITPDKLYRFHIGSLAISAVNRSLIANDIKLIPLYDKKEFQKKIKVTTIRYVANVPSVEFRNVDWWRLVNGEEFLSGPVEIKNPVLENYLDLSLPNNGPKVHSFPDQLLMQVGLPVNISKVFINNLKMSYEEYHPKSGKSGILYFDHINAHISNITNVPQAMKKNSHTVIDATSNFMHHIPLKANINFDLNKIKTGAFSASLQTGGFDGTEMNSIAEPLGLFEIKNGQVLSSKANIQADNYNGVGKILFEYKNLHITPLKKDSLRASGFKMKSFTSFVANAFVIKDDNPKSNDKEPRLADANYKRDPTGTFFNLIWKVTLVGILKTTGIPVKLAY